MSSIQEKIAKIQADAEAAILKLKQEAASEIAKRLSEAKEKLKDAETEVKRLQNEYALATGKTVKGERIGSSRRRLTPKQKTELEEKVKELLKNEKGGMKLSELVAAVGESHSAVRKAIKTLGKAVSTTGSKASTRYLSK